MAHDDSDDLDLDRAIQLDVLAGEYREALARGDAPSPEEFAESHPDVETELLAVLRGMALLERPKGPIGPLRRGQRVGSATIQRELGRGGMGVVYEAVEESLGRVIAMKAIDASRTDERFRARFQREARAAARLDHPGIVPVYGSGQDGSILWYAMRKIDGVALDAVLHALTAPEGSDDLRKAESALSSIASDESSGSVGGGTPAQRAAARIVARIAEALAYAHAEGVLHRDVKPGNVMLDRDGAPLLADFGLCKIEGDASLTGEADIVGTLRYLPPEALDASADARGDVYGAGLVLYELLARRPAFAASDRASMLKRILHEDPPSLRKIAPGIPGDLVRIVAKATAKLPEQRYATAGDLADDLNRFLDGRPVQVRAPSAFYLARLFVRRNRALVAAAVALVVALGLGVIGTTIGFVRAVEAREAAEKNEALASAELAKSSVVTSFLQDLLKGSSPWVAAGRDTSLLQSILDDAASRVGASLAEQPEAEATIRGTLGGTFLQLGDLEAAQRELDRSLDLMTATLDADDPATFRVRRSLGWLALECADPATSLAYFEENLRLRPLDLEALEVGAIEDLHGVLGVHFYRFEYSEVIEATEEVVPKVLSQFGIDEWAAQKIISDRAEALVNMGEFDEGLELLTNVFDAQSATWGREHPWTTTTMRDIGAVHRRKGDLDAAEPIYREYVAICRRVFGEESSRTAVAKNSLGLLLGDRGHHDEAVEILEEVVEAQRRLLGEEHRDTLVGIYNLASAYESAGRYDESTDLMTERLEIHRRHYGERHEQTLLAQVNTAIQRMHVGRVKESLDLYADAVAKARTVDGFDKGFLGYFLVTYGQGLMGQSRGREADTPRKETEGHKGGE
ncbi:MAG: serine/threonine-protein kinase [Planctomycetota bacterium]